MNKYFYTSLLSASCKTLNSSNLENILKIFFKNPMFEKDSQDSII